MIAKGYLCYVFQSEYNIIFLSHLPHCSIRSCILLHSLYCLSEVDTMALNFSIEGMFLKLIKVFYMLPKPSIIKNYFIRNQMGPFFIACKVSVKNVHCYNRSFYIISGSYIKLLYLYIGFLNPPTECINPWVYLNHVSKYYVYFMCVWK